MKLKAKRGLLLAVCAAAIVPLAAIPLGWFAVTDAALVGQRQNQETPYTSLVPTGNDYYLLRQLNTRVKLAERGATGPLYDPENGTEGMYLSGASYISGMDSAGTDMVSYMDEILLNLKDDRVLPEYWYVELRREIDYWGGQVYYSTDSLGFVRLSAFGGENQEVCLANLEVDSLTGKVVSLWLSLEETYEVDVGEVLLAWVELNELEGLGDWAVPVGTDYELSGLYSENGQALMTCATGEVSTYSYSSEPRYFFSLQLGPRDLEVSQ